MRVATEVRDHVAASFFASMGPYLDEKLMRLSAGALASAFGEGSAEGVAAAAGLAGSTVRAGMRDVADESVPAERIRRAGAGRPGIEQARPGVWGALDALIEPEERGDPETPLRWTVKSTRTLAGDLAGQGFAISHTTVAGLLRGHGYSLRGTAKVLEGMAVHGPDRDRQFRHINDTTRAFLADGQPVISVDTKKKEAIGNFERPGLTWRPYQDPVKVADHSFAGEFAATAIPYGIYDVGANRGFVNVGISHDTPTFAVASIRRWWAEAGHGRYPGATRLLLIADSGGSNAARSLVFKVLLHQFALETGLEVTVCHLPAGTSKWNKVEHRLFAQISSNWRGRPLTSLDAVISSIAATTTRTGLTVRCVLDEDEYPTGVTGSWDQVDALPITFGEFRGTWNYTIAPTPAGPAAGRAAARRPGAPSRPKRSEVTLLAGADERAAWIARLTVPEVTGVIPATWRRLTARIEAAYRMLRRDEAVQAGGGQHGANSYRHERDLKIAISTLMLATVLHQRHRLPVAQIGRLIELNPVSLKQHITRLAPLFAEYGQPITPTETKIKKVEQFSVLLPQDAPPTRDVTT